MKEQNFQRATKAVIVARVSTEGQGDDDHYSIPAQLRSLRAYVERGGRFGTLSKENILAEHELKESAFQGERPEFAKVADFVEGYSEPIALIFDNIDRFSRQVRSELLIRLDELRKDRKAELHFVTMGLVLAHDSSANELMVWNILLAVAEGQSRTISEKVKKGIKEKLERGEYNGYAPTGYKNIKVEVATNRFESRIEVDEERAPFIRKIFQLYSTDRYSTEDLAKTMENAGFAMKGKRGRNGNDKLEEKKEARKVTKTDVLNILRNPFYYGKFYARDYDTNQMVLFPRNGLAINYAPLITKELFDRVQNILDSNNSRHNGFNKNSFKFRGLLECEFCGCTLTPEEMSRTYKNGKDNPLAKEAIYYHCSSGKSLVNHDFYLNKFGTDHSGVYISKRGKNKGQQVVGCPQRWWKESEIEEFILHEFDMMHYDDSVYDTLKRMLRRDYEERMETADKEIRGLKIKYGKNEEAIRAFTHKFATITNKRLEEDMMKEYNKLKKEQDDLRNEIAIFEEVKEIDTDKIIDTMKLCCNLREHYLSLDIEKQQELLTLCFSKIVAAKGTWRTNGGRGKRVKTESLYPFLNEPFATLMEIKVDEIIAQEEDERRVKINLTKEKDMKASLFP